MVPSLDRDGGLDLEPKGRRLSHGRSPFIWNADRIDLARNSLVRSQRCPKTGVHMGPLETSEAHAGHLLDTIMVWRNGQIYLLASARLIDELANKVKARDALIWL